MPVAARLALVAATAGLATAPGAHAATSVYVARSFAEPAGSGLAVTGPLSGMRAGASARVLVPRSWRARAASAARLRLATATNPSCRYDISYVIASTVGPDQDPAARAAAALPAQSSRHLLDAGQRRASAFRVVRRPGIGGRVRVDGLWTAVLTRRADIAPAGQVVWTDIRVTALSRAGDECHAGTWREGVGPAIADSLAVARARLRLTPVRP